VFYGHPNSYFFSLERRVDIELNVLTTKVVIASVPEQQINAFAFRCQVVLIILLVCSDEYFILVSHQQVVDGCVGYRIEDSVNEIRLPWFNKVPHSRNLLSFGIWRKWNG